MERIIIICEGPTEEEFCKKTLTPYFQKQQIYVQSPLIKHSNGGIVRWNILKKQIENHLKQDTTAHVTLLIDYYGLYQKYEFPGWEESLAIIDKNSRLDFLEQKMSESIEENLRYRFIPYMQLHEFEGILFYNLEIFDLLFNDDEILDREELEAIFREFDNPEMINNCPDTAPSKRLKRIIKGYNKIVYGNILAEAIGLTGIKAKCPRFNNWITILSSISKPLHP